MPPKQKDIFPPNSLRTSTTRSYPLCKCRSGRAKPAPDYTDPNSNWPERIPIDDVDIPAFNYIAVKNRPEHKRRKEALKAKKNKRQADSKRRKYQEDPEFREAVKKKVRERQADPDEKAYRNLKRRGSETAKEQSRASYQRNKEQKLAKKRENYRKLKENPEAYKEFLDKQNKRRRKK
jgi:hypothetical protein